MEVSEVEAWVHTHRGDNPQAPDELNTAEATACLETYKRKSLELNGPEFDWLHSPVDVRALYECSCGRSHGKWATFNGAVDGTEALAEVRSGHDSIRAAKRQRQEDEERLKRRQAHDTNAAKMYAQTVLEWGKGIEQRDQNMQSFMQNVARQLGMPPSAVPAPLPPLPPPPVYCASSSLDPEPDAHCGSASPHARCASTSPHAHCASDSHTHGASATHAHGASASPHSSPDHEDNFASAIGMDNPEATLERIALGVFGGFGNGNTRGGVAGFAGHANGITNGGGSFSPNLADELPPF
ncbi:hypothetical protein ACP70R_031486 [Stipagrostis hirtigluma subsp. patula]